MYQVQRFLDSISNCSFSHYMYRIVALTTFIAFWLMSNLSFALEPNPGAICPSSTVQGKFADNDYANLLSSYNNNNYVAIAGTPANTIPLSVNMNISQTKNSTVTPSIGSTYLHVDKTGNDKNLTTTAITLSFRNSSNATPLYLSNVALSIFDIDRSIPNTNNGRGWSDKVTITGKTASGDIIANKTFGGSNITNSQNIFFPNKDVQCSTVLDTSCQASISFSQPVDSVTMSYGHTDEVRKPSNQDIDFRVDNYCYTPPLSYDISKTDGINSIGTNNTTNYIIKVTNTGSTTLNDIILKDPIVSGLSKRSSITCDTTDTSNSCTTVPTVSQLEGAGFTIPSIAVGKSYSIRIPTFVSASTGSTVTNTATISHTTLSTKSASDSNTVTSIFDGGSTTTPATCSSGHQMYYFGANKPAGAIQPSNISWANGSVSNEYTFNGIKFKLAFSEIEHLLSGYPSYGSNSNATENALNMFHSSQRAAINHKLTATIDRPVSKYGFVVQDLDTNEIGKYIESMSLVTAGGLLSKYRNDYFSFSNSNRTISGTQWNNCSTSNSCNFNVDWGYNSANTPFVVTHGNTYSEASTTSSTGNHLMGYSDFYFCLAPPKLIVKKALNGNRIHDTDSKRDQFEIKVTGGSITANSFTTTGTGATINNDSSKVLSLAESTNYTITERVMNGSTLGDISHYNATYTCTNATTNSTTVIPTAAMQYDATAKTRSFTIANTTYGDEITCTITNSPASYTFSGIVFNDNGGITDAQADVRNANFLNGTYNNANYFNGLFDTATETGIAGSTVSLVNCTNASTVYATKAVENSGSTTGKYQITVASSTLAGNNPVCLVEINNATNPAYPIRTTTEKQSITLIADSYSYTNNDFGRVIANNAALVLEKEQAANNCTFTNFTSLTYSKNPLSSSTSGIGTDIKPGQCIAYKITATNRANIAIDNFVMRDVLQRNDPNNPADPTVTSVLAAPTRASGIFNDGLSNG
ncbi:hypothetical protein AAIR29_03755 [Psychrobacter sp. FBL11]|uniref:DUF11 domain-containing protein n=1 Tax=Psychrobacter saeujeotis TaxID=3143436 RepID=A0ABU9X5R1_9GAMM|nr:hypothetical protein [uncultured Psychrobacter sp.]